MSLLFETIAIRDGVACHLSWHEKRMNEARREVWNEDVPLTLSLFLSVPDRYRNGLVRCNVYYGPEVEKVTFGKYEKRHIYSLKLVEASGIDYHLKYADRSGLEALFGLRGDNDDILIVRDGFITDSSVANIIFTDGERWFTPAVPLLKGTCRNRLIEEGFLLEKEIRVSDLSVGLHSGFRINHSSGLNFGNPVSRATHHEPVYRGFKLINAMRDPDGEEVLPVSQILGL